MHLIDHFLRAAAREPERIAFVQPDGARLTYAEVAVAVEEVAGALLARGVARGSVPSSLPAAAVPPADRRSLSHP